MTQHCEGIRRVLSLHKGQEIPRGVPLPKEDLDSIRMGTTVATNALLERKGTKHAFLVTKGFSDLLRIGYQSRPSLFDLNIVKPEVLYTDVREIDERVTIEGFDEDLDGLFKPDEEIPGVLLRGSSGDMVRILKPLDEVAVRRTLRELRSQGYETVAVCLAHSYVFPAHESRIEELALEEGFTHVSLSSSVAARMIKMVPRGSSSSADAYLTPEIKSYLNGFSKGFESGNLDGVRCDFMQSDGGLVRHDRFSGLRGILSGPAGETKPTAVIMGQDTDNRQVVLSAMPAHRTTVALKSRLLVSTWEAPRLMFLGTAATSSTSSRVIPRVLPSKAHNSISTLLRPAGGQSCSGEMVYL